LGFFGSQAISVGVLHSDLVLLVISVEVFPCLGTLALALAFFNFHLTQWFPNFFGPPPPRLHELIVSAPLPYLNSPYIQKSDSDNPQGAVITFLKQIINLQFTFILNKKHFTLIATLH
jgi:hypothetical protein